LVFSLDEQPAALFAGLSAVASHVNQNKGSPQLFAFELNFELAPGEAVGGEAN